MLKVYSQGIGYCSVCTDLDNLQEIERQANVQCPTGIQTPWRIADENFKTGEPNPCDCNEDETRKHYLLSC